MLQDVVLHDFIVTMGINADVMIMPETVVHDTAKDTMSIGITGNTMDYMIGLSIVQPLTFIYIIIGRFWGWQESKVADNATIILDDKAAIPFHVCRYDSLRRIAISPLVHIIGAYCRTAA